MHARIGLHIGHAVLACCAAVVAGCTSSAGGPRAATPQRTRTAVHSTGRTAAATPPSRQRTPVTMSFAGDVHFEAQLGTRLANDPATVFGPAAAQLRRADLTMVNLETAVTTAGVRQSKEFTFRAPPAAFTALREAGVDVATMANNHGADYGAAGLRDTFAAMRSARFPVIGIGPDADVAFAPFTTTLRGTRVAIFAADQVHDETTLPLFSAGAHRAGVANAYDPRLVGAVRAAKRAGYLVIVYVHWGVEYQTCPSADQSRLAAQLAAAGAAAVVGTHAHVLQGAGWLGNGTFVAYGLGNYLWWRTFGNDQDDNGVLTLTFERGRVTGSHFAPSHLDGRGVPVPAVGADRRRIAGEFAADRSCTDLSAKPPPH